MPHAALRIIPGVDTTKTPALNEAAISQSNLIRFLPDKDGALPQKIGGWTQFYPSSIGSPVRALKAWQDLNANAWLGVGAESSLSVINNGALTNITPSSLTTNLVPWNQSTGKGSITATAGSATFTITDSSASSSSAAVNTNSYVNFSIPVSVAGIILSGIYPITSVSAGSNQYTISAQSLALFSTDQTATFSGNTATVTLAPATNTAVVFTSTGTLPSGISANTTYYVINSSATQFTVAAAPNGSTITLGSPTGTVTAHFVPQTRYLTIPAASSTVNVYFPSAVIATGNNQTFPVANTFTYPSQTIVVSGVYPATFVSVGQFSIPLPVSAPASPSSSSQFDNSGNPQLVYYIAPTPGGPAIGYGLGGYGVVPYGGSSLPATPGSPISTTNWFLDNWGQNLIATPKNGPIYTWQPNGALPNAQYIYNAPLTNAGAFVAMPQRQIVAFGSSYSSITDPAAIYTTVQDPLLVRWCDNGNYNIWTASSTNQAGSYRIPTGSRIVGGMQGPQQALLWTDIDVWSMQYIGAPLVYGFNKIGSNCGLISSKAAGQINNSIFWMSQKQFFSMTASGIIPMVCPVWDIVFQNLNQNYLDRIRCAPSTSFNEVYWYYPSANGGGEVDSYVKLNVLTQGWDYGSLSRTAWIDQSVLGSPIGAGSDNYLYQHEVGYNAAGSQINSSFTTGYFAIAEGDNMVFVDQIWPDMKFTAVSGTVPENVYLVVNTVNYPTDTPISYGPFLMNQSTSYISCRIRGRLFSFTVYSNDSSQTFWRLGRIRYRFAPDGKF